MVFFFYFQDVATCGSSSEDCTFELTSHLAGKAFDFFMKNMRRTPSFRITQKTTIHSRKLSFLFLENLNFLKRAVSAQSHAAMTSLIMVHLFVKWTFYLKKPDSTETQKSVLLRKVFMKQPELSQFLMCGNTLTTLRRRRVFSFFFSAREVFSSEPSSSSLTPKKIIQCPDVGPCKIGDKADALTSQLSDLMLIIKTSRCVAVSDFERTPDRVCLYCQKSNHFSMVFSRNQHTKTQCASCGRAGHSETLFSRKQTKNSQASSAGSSPTVGVTLLKSDNGPASTKDVAASIMRTADAETVKKHARQASEIQLVSISPPHKRFTPTAAQFISKKKKLKRKISKQGLGRYAAIYNVVTKLANASSSLTFGQLARGDGEKAEADILRSISRGAKARKSPAAAITASKTFPRRISAAQIKFYGQKTKALSNSGAVPSLVSAKLCSKVNLEADRRPFGLIRLMDSAPAGLELYEKLQTLSITFV